MQKLGALLACLTTCAALNLAPVNMFDSQNSVTVVKNSEGKPECTGCRGDVSDLVDPFYRFNANGQKKISEFTVPKGLYFWNAKETKECLKDKYILFLGDSTLLENLNTIMVLMAGGPSKFNAKNFFYDSTHVKPEKHGGMDELRYKTEDDELVAKYFDRNRNQTITMGNTKIKYLFTAHEDLKKDCGGLEHMVSDKVKKAIDDLVSKEGRVPDVIVTSAGAHDMCRAEKEHNNLVSYYSALDRVGPEMIKGWSDKGIKVLWRGNYRFEGERQDVNPAHVMGDWRYPKEMDDKAKSVVEANGGTFIDVAEVLAKTHDSSGCCKTMRGAVDKLPHLGPILLYRQPKASVFLGQLPAFRILDGICEK